MILKHNLFCNYSRQNISGKEQLAISLRWVTNSYKIHEDLIGLVYVETTDALTLTTVIKDSLIRCALSLSSCRGQAYDTGVQSWHKGNN